MDSYTARLTAEKPASRALQSSKWQLVDKSRRSLPSVLSKFSRIFKKFIRVCSLSLCAASSCLSSRWNFRTEQQATTSLTNEIRPLRHLEPQYARIGVHLVLGVLGCTYNFHCKLRLQNAYPRHPLATPMGARPFLFK